MATFPNQHDEQSNNNDTMAGTRSSGKKGNQGKQGTQDNDRTQPGATRDMDVDGLSGTKRGATNQGNENRRTEEAGPSAGTQPKDLPPLLTYISLSAGMKPSKTPIEALKTRIVTLLEKLWMVDDMILIAPYRGDVNSCEDCLDQ